MNSWILPRYVIRSALFAMLGAVVGLWLLQMVFAYLSEMENLSETYRLSDAWWYIFYRSPYFLVQFIPTGALLGVVVGLGLLAGNSELVVMRAAGISIYRIIGWAMLPAFLFVLISLSINQFILPISSQKAAAITGSGSDGKLIAVNGYWSVEQHDSGTDIVYISYADSQGKLGQTKRYHLDNNANLTQAISASGGDYVFAKDPKDEDHVWQLQDVNRVTINSWGVMQGHDDKETLKLPIAPTDVHLLTRDAEDLSLSDLYAHKRLMDSQNLRSLRHELAFWQKLFSPFAVLSLVLVASSFVFGSLRSQGLGWRSVMALSTGLLFRYLTDRLGVVALAYKLSPVLMSALPIVISAVVGVWLLNRR